MRFILTGWDIKQAVKQAHGSTDGAAEFLAHGFPVSAGWQCILAQECAQECTQVFSAAFSDES